jgi:hypothetical protein
VTIEQMENYARGTHIQHAMPNVSAEDREFILSGITPEEWAEEFGKEEPTEADYWDGDDSQTE